MADFSVPFPPDSIFPYRQEQKSLDAQVFLEPDSTVGFVRLTMLAGGGQKAP